MFDSLIQKSSDISNGTKSKIYQRKFYLKALNLYFSAQIKRENLVSHIRDQIPTILNDWFHTLDSLDAKLTLKRTEPQIEFNYFTIKNRRRTLEDRITIIEDLNLLKKDLTINIWPHCLFAVYDGHCGSETANYVSTHLPLQLVKHENYDKNIENAFIETFDKLNQKLLEKAKNESFKSGTTCCLAIIKGNKLHLAWCGDSSACLFDKNVKQVFKTKTHKPNDDLERERIEKSGGSVVFSAKEWRINGNLSVARSFGDYDYHKVISSQPDVHTIELNGLTHNYLIIACDGLWEYIDNEQIKNIVNDSILNNNTKQISELLVQKAKQNGSQDNITCIFISLNTIESQTTSL